MFDSVIHPGTAKRSSWGSGTVIAIIVHGSALALAMYLSKHPPKLPKAEIALTFFKSPPPPPPPPPPPKKSKPEPKVERKPVPRKPDTIVAPKELPKEKPPEAEPEKEDEGVEGGVEGGVAGGVVGGVIGGVVGGIGNAPPPPQQGPVEFNDTMTPPAKLSGPDPEYTQKALDHEVQGLMRVKCIVTTDGVVRNCHVVQSLPFMDRAVLDALERRRYKPAMFQGKPIDVNYTFNIRLNLPR
jgi:protein TonB